MDKIAKMSPEEIEATMKEAATPGPEHKKLRTLVGKWNTVSKFWMAPNTEPLVDTGSAQKNWILGRKFIRENYRGTWHGKPFRGNGILGFDKVKNKYIATWMDSMASGISSGEGTYLPTANLIEIVNTYSCPMAGHEIQSVSKLRFVDKNKHVYEMYSTMPDGSSFKAMEITYSRES